MACPTLRLLGILSIMALSATHATPADAPPREDHGITLFYTTDTPVEDLTGLKFPEVYGGELIIFWHEFEPGDGRFDWERLDRDFDAWHRAGKKLDIRLSTAHVSPIYTPKWVYENYHVRRIGRGIFENFEGETLRYEIGAVASLSGEAEHVYSGERALLVHNTANEHQPFLTLKGAPLDADTQYSIQWDLLPIGTAAPVAEITSAEGDVVQRHEVHPNREGWNVATAELKLEGEAGQSIRLVAGPGDHFAVDNVNIIRTSPQAPFRKTDPSSGDILDWVVEEDTNAYSTEEFTTILTNDPVHFPLRKGDGLQTRFTIEADLEGEIRCVVRSTTDPAHVILDSVEPLRAGERQQVRFHVPQTLPSDDFQVVVLYRGAGAFRIESADWRRWTDFVTVFPDYFSNDFNVLWRRAVAAFADRYRDHPALGIVSVGGFGRWEEVMLDEDVYGALDDQWLSRGFTQERYLDQVSSCMDLYRELLPTAELRICLAYGLKEVNDVDWVYRRTAQEAVKRGIGLKQNGLSEKYDTWDDNTNTSYLYHLYRNNPEVSLTHETGGQIFRNLADAHGYPLSLLNRTAANYTDYLFLYFNDIHGRHIRKYFHTFLEHARRTRPTTFHTWLGDMSQIHEHRSLPVATQNSWFGLRQFDGPGQTPLKTRVAGEKVMKTNASNKRIVLDVDDRFQYHGMYGAELSIDYYDAPEGPFQVFVHDNRSASWRSLGTVQRSGRDGFRRAFFHDATWNRSARHGGEDVHADVMIKEPSGRAPLAVRNVELQFVAAPDWKRRALTGVNVPDAGVTANPTLTHSIDHANADGLPHAASILIYAPALDRTTVVGRLYGRREALGREELLSEKEFHIPGDGEELLLPFTPSMGIGSYRVELTTLTGEAGWYLDEGGRPAIHLLGYVPARNGGVPGEFRTLHQGSSLKGIIEAKAPIQALDLHFRNPAPAAQMNLRVRRELPGTGWSAPLVDIARHHITKDGALTLPLEPQPAGRFLVEVEGHWQGADIATHPGGELHISPVHLVPAVEQRKPRRIPLDHIRVRRDSPSDWVVAGGLGPTNEASRYEVTDFDPAVELGVDVEATVRQRLILRMKNETGANMARVFWTTGDSSFTPENSVFLPLVPNDEYTRDYSFPVGLEARWEGRITRLRVQPATGSTRHGWVSIEEIILDENRVLTDLHFARDTDYLVPERGIRNVEKSEGGVLVTVDGPEPVLRVPLQDFNVETSANTGGEILTIRMRNMTSSEEMRLLWHIPVPGFLNPSRAFEKEPTHQATIPITANDEEVREYHINLSEFPQWQGHVVAFAIIPAAGAREAEQVLIESLRIEDRDPVPGQEEAVPGR